MNAPQTAIDKRTSRAIGHHVLLDFHGVRDARLQDAGQLAELLWDLLIQHGFRCLELSKHQFPGEGAGATAMVLLSESHATIHTYPEHDYAALDVFSCGNADLDGLVESLTNALAPEHVERIDQVRGAALRKK